MESLLITIGRYMFYICGILACIGAICMLFSKNAIHNIIFFLLTMIAIAGCYICLSAELLAIAQLLIYAGGIIVLFLFIIMLVETTNEKKIKLFHTQTPYVLCLTLSGILTVIGIIIKTWFSFTSTAHKTLIDSINNNTHVISNQIFTNYALPFEILSIILLVAIIGTVILAKNR